MRKYTYLFILFFSLNFQLSSIAQTTQDPGISFFKGSWKSLLNKAASQQKLIFVDVYTDWCLPCKRMDKEVFPLAEVGQVYNKLFVNYKLNAEQGEGISLARRYAIKSYPTYLFLDGNGTLVYRSDDYMKATDFIAAARNAKAKQEETGSLAALEAIFRRGNRQPSFLKTLLEKRSSLKLDNTEVLNAYVATLSTRQLHDPETLNFLSNHLGSTFSSAVPVILAGIKRLDGTNRQKVADRLYNGVLYYALGIAIKENRLTEAKEILADLGQIRPLLSERHLPSADNLTLHYYKAAKDTAGLKKIGYQMAAKQLKIPLDSIRKKDRLWFDQDIGPFLSGKQDSTKIPRFSEEKKRAATQYSATVATTLYTVANAFNLTLAPKDKALVDALDWISYACQLYQSQTLLKLKSELEQRVRSFPD